MSPCVEKIVPIYNVNIPSEFARNIPSSPGLKYQSNANEEECQVLAAYFAVFALSIKDTDWKLNKIFISNINI